MSGYEWLITVHAFVALVALPLGAYQLLRKRRGDALHRRVGRTWVLALGFVATSSFAIRDLRPGQFSLLHILSVVTLITVTLGVVHARRGNIDRHRGMMRGSWLGLVGAFIGAVAVPDRTIPTFVVSDPVGALGALAAVAAVSVAVVLIGSLRPVHASSRSSVMGRESQGVRGRGGDPGRGGQAASPHRR